MDDNSWRGYFFDCREKGWTESVLGHTGTHTLASFIFFFLPRELCREFGLFLVFMLHATLNTLYADALNPLLLLPFFRGSRIIISAMNGEKKEYSMWQGVGGRGRSVVMH